MSGAYRCVESGNQYLDLRDDVLPGYLDLVATVKGISLSSEEMLSDLLGRMDHRLEGKIPDDENVRSLRIYEIEELIDLKSTDIAYQESNSRLRSINKEVGNLNQLKGFFEVDKKQLEDLLLVRKIMDHLSTSRSTLSLKTASELVSLIGDHIVLQGKIVDWGKSPLAGAVDTNFVFGNFDESRIKGSLTKLITEKMTHEDSHSVLDVLTDVELVNITHETDGRKLRPNKTTRKRVEKLFDGGDDHMSTIEPIEDKEGDGVGVVSFRTLANFVLSYDSPVSKQILKS